MTALTGRAAATERHSQWQQSAGFQIFAQAGPDASALGLGSGNAFSIAF
jgi:hypothetical protein